jgi:hypothetical protein
MVTHYQYCASKQQDKAIIELATRLYSWEVKQLLIKLLTEANAEVKAAHESERGQELLHGNKSLPDVADEDLDIDMGHSELAASVTESDQPLRHRKQPERFISTLAETYREAHIALLELQI